MSDYKTYGVPRSDDDCYFESIWHWLPGPKIAVHTLYIAGYTWGTEVKGYSGPHDDMPDEVKGWFHL